ncbi:uncharacterized protein [Argopecten irradians]|uniref:uncharacterized protein n=1 Tax=Argopecten irradians TaxID=31199 RepID=UPI00371B1791
MEAKRFVTAGLLLLLAAIGSVPSVWAVKPLEGAMISPVMRSAMWAYLGNAAYANQLWQAVNHDYYSRLNCGGIRTTDADYEQKCAPCGDSATSNKPNESGGKYAIGQVVAQYHEGQHINISLDIRQLNTGGTFRFSLCVTNNSTKVSHACFQQHVLKWQNTQITEIPSARQLGLATYTLQLPTGVKCQNCVVQWLWRDGTTACDPPGSNNCGQQTITNCADVQILDAGIPFSENFDKPRYDAYSSIFDPMDPLDGDIHGIGIHVPRSSLDPAITLQPGGTAAPGGSIPIVLPGGNPSPNPSPGGSVPIVIPGGGSTSSNSSTDGSDPPDTSEKLVEPAVLIPAIAGTSSVLAGENGIGLALILLAFFMYISSAYNRGLTGYSAQPSYFSSPLPPQPFLNSPMSFQQSAIPRAPIFNSGVPLYASEMNGGAIQSGFGGTYYANNNFASGIVNPGISAVPQANFGSSGAAVLQQQPSFVNTNTVPMSTRLPMGLSQSGPPLNIGTGFTSLQTPLQASGGVPSVFQQNTGFIPQAFSGNSMPVAGSNIPLTNTGFSSVTTQQFPQSNSGFVTIPSQQPVFNGNIQTQTTIMSRPSIIAPIPTRADLVVPAFDKEPSTVREKEIKRRRNLNDKDEAQTCECRATIFFMTAHCHSLSAKECREDDACSCKQDNQAPPILNQLQHKSPNRNQVQKMSPIQNKQFQRRLRTMQNKQQ